MAELRSLVLVLGDQLDLEAAAFDGFEPQLDAVWMAEVVDESTHVGSSRPRTVMFLAAMRHFALALQSASRPLHYTRLDAPDNRGSLAEQLRCDIERLRPARLVMTAPGDWRVLQALKTVAEACAVPLEVREDRHFFVSVREFAAHARGRKSLRMEYFYREQRKRHRVLMDPQNEDTAARRTVEFRCREPRGLWCCRPWRSAGALPLRARCADVRGDRARERSALRSIRAASTASRGR